MSDMSVEAVQPEAPVAEPVVEAPVEPAAEEAGETPEQEQAEELAVAQAVIASVTYHPDGTFTAAAGDASATFDTQDEANNWLKEHGSTHE